MQVLVNIIATVVSLGLLAVAGYILKSVLEYQKDFIKFKTQTEHKIANLEKSSRERLEWLRKLDDGLHKMNLNIVRIGTKMDMAEDEFHKIPKYQESEES